MYELVFKASLLTIDSKVAGGLVQWPHKNSQFYTNTSLTQGHGYGVPNVHKMYELVFKASLLTIDSKVAGGLVQWPHKNSQFYTNTSLTQGHGYGIPNVHKMYELVCKASLYNDRIKVPNYYNDLFFLHHSRNGEKEKKVLLHVNWINIT